MKTPTKYPGIPWGKKLTELETALELAWENPSALESTLQRIEGELLVIKRDRASNDDTIKAIGGLEQMISGYRGTTQRVYEPPVTHLKAAEYRYVAQEPQQVYTTDSLVRLAQNIHKTHEQVFPEIYSEFGIQEARKHTQRIIDAIKEGNYLEAMRISHMYGARYMEFELSDACPNRDEVRAHMLKFMDLVKALEEHSGVKAYDFEYKSEFQIQVNGSVNLEGIARSVNETFGYFAPAMISSGKDKLNLLTDKISLAFIATINQRGPGLYDILLYNIPTFDVGKESLMAHLQPHTI